MTMPVAFAQPSAIGIFLIGTIPTMVSDLFDR
jgi:hypothetical protein